jgi:hypothetical protein
LSRLIGEFASQARIAVFVAEPRHCLARRASVAQRLTLVTLDVAKATLGASSLTGDVDCSARKALVAHLETEVISKWAAFALRAW